MELLDCGHLLIMTIAWPNKGMNIIISKPYGKKEYSVGYVCEIFQSLKEVQEIMRFLA